MTYSRALPHRYKIPGGVNLCSNHLTEVEIPLEFRGQPLLLVGEGAVPLLWLAAPESPGGQDLGWIVKESSSVNPAVNVDIDRKKGRVSVRVTGELVIQLEKRVETIEILRLNLRPLGLNVVGDRKGLTIGGTLLSGNKISRSEVAFALG